MMEAFVESGMTFGPFEDASCFRIEKSKLFDRCKGIRSVEFIYRPKKNKLFFIEAKASSPVQRTGNEEQYHRFVDEIMEKFSHSLELYLAGILERKSGHEEMADALKKADYQKMKFYFVLIINGHEAPWLLPLQDEFNRKMGYLKKIWDGEVLVMNEESAREYRLIQ